MSSLLRRERSSLASALMGAALVLLLGTRTTGGLPVPHCTPPAMISGPHECSREGSSTQPPRRLPKR